MNQKFFPRNNHNRTSLFAHQSRYQEGFLRSKLSLCSHLPNSFSQFFSLCSRPRLSPPSRTSLLHSPPVKERRTFSDPSSPDSDFTREENFSFYPGGRIINKARLRPVNSGAKEPSALYPKSRPFQLSVSFNYRGKSESVISTPHIEKTPCPSQLSYG